VYKYIAKCHTKQIQLTIYFYIGDTKIHSKQQSHIASAKKILQINELDTKEVCEILEAKGLAFFHFIYVHIIHA